MIEDQDMERIESKKSEQPPRQTKPLPQGRIRRRLPPARALARRTPPQRTPSGSRRADGGG